MRTAKPRSRTSRASAIVLSVLTALSISLAAACGGGGSSASVPKPEQKSLRVGVVKNEIGALPIWLGTDQGMFAAKGLDVTVVADFTTDEEALRALKDQKVDVVYCDYARAIEARSLGDYLITLVAEGYNAGPGSVNMIERSTTNSTIAQDVHRAFNATGGILVPGVGAPDAAVNYSVPALMLANALVSMGGDLRIDGTNKAQKLKQEFQSAMPDRLDTKNSFAAVMSEPYWSYASSKGPMSVLLDLTTGDNESMPLGGYFAEQDFALQKVNTLKAFTSALNDAKTAASSRANATAELVAHYAPNGTKLSSDVATSVALGTFPLSVNAKRVQRVLDSMQRIGLAPFFKLDAMLPPDAIH